MDVIEVAIGPTNADGIFKVDVLRSRAGEASVNVALDAETILARRAQLQQAVLASAVPSRAILSEAERPVREVGIMLFSALLGTSEVAGRYRASAALAADGGQGLRIVLRTDSALVAGLPWETMYDNAVGAYVCRREQLVRQVPVASVAAPLAVQPPLRILGIVSSPRGLAMLDVEKEQKQLTHALGSLRNNGLVNVHWVPNAIWTELQDLLLSQEWHAVHFIGHGDFDFERDEGVLALVGENGRRDIIEAGRLIDLLRQARPMPRLVVLNSCSGAAIGAQDLFSGTAATLVRGGVSAVAAMQYEISDSAAVAFARGFYTAIAHGRGVDDAVSSGRVSILGVGTRSLEWVTPVLYLRGNDGHLFALSSETTAGGAVDNVLLKHANSDRDAARPGSPVGSGILKVSDHASEKPFEARGNDSRILEIDLAQGAYRMGWSTTGKGAFVIRHESARDGKGEGIVFADPPNPDSGEAMVRVTEGGRQVFSIKAHRLVWQLTLTFVLPLNAVERRTAPAAQKRENLASDEPHSVSNTSFADLQASVIAALEAVGPTSGAFGGEMDSFQAASQEASRGMERTQEARAREVILRSLISETYQPIERMRELANTYSSQMQDLDKAIRAYVAAAPGEIGDNADIQSQVCQDFAAINRYIQRLLHMSAALRGLMNSLDRSRSAYSALESIAQYMKPILTKVLESTAAAEGWLREINDAPIDCDNS